MQVDAKLEAISKSLSPGQEKKKDNGYGEAEMEQGKEGQAGAGEDGGDDLADMFDPPPPNTQGPTVRRAVCTPLKLSSEGTDQDAQGSVNKTKEQASRRRSDITVEAE
ncbi:hypothetical protein ACGC1H_000197 [Rhizoctonia solani]